MQLAYAAHSRGELERLVRDVEENAPRRAWQVPASWCAPARAAPAGPKLGWRERREKRRLERG